MSIAYPRVGVFGMVTELHKSIRGLTPTPAVTIPKSEFQRLVGFP